MPRKIQRFHVDTLIKGKNGKIFNVNHGVLANSGDINSHNKRLAQHALMQKFHKKRRELFGQHDYHILAYDCANTLYLPDGVYLGRNEEECTFKSDDFSPEQWNITSKLSRKKDYTYVMKIRPSGFIYTSGEEASEVANRMELTRCVEIVTSQKLNNSDYCQFGNDTFSFRAQPVSEPDATSEIRSGFAKVSRIVEGRNGKNEMLMAIDTKASPFYKSTSVLNFVCGKYLEKRGSSRNDYRGRGDYNRKKTGGGSTDAPDHQDVAEVERSLEYRENRQQIEEALKGLLVSAAHLKNSTNLIMISRVAETNSETTKFMTNNGEREISVADHYLEAYNYRLKYPKMPLVVSKRFRDECFYPMELLQVAPGQRIKDHKMSAAVQMAMKGQKSTLPQKHVDLVKHVLSRNLKLDRNLYMDAFGIKLESAELVKLQSKILPPPQIKFKDEVYMPKMGNPVFRTNGRFVDPADINAVAIVVFDRAIDMRQAENFCDRLSCYCRENGITVKKSSRDWPIREINSEDSVAIKNAMEKWFSKGVNILVAIAKEKKPDVHDVLKYYEASVGLQTIQVCKQTVDMMLSSGGRQTADNVMRKFNLKCGGTNFFVQIPRSVNGRTVCADAHLLNEKLFERVQFIGFDISHGASRTLFDRSTGKMDGEVSIVGVSYSLSHSTHLGGFAYMQTQKEYKLQKLDEVFPKCVDSYRNHTGRLPSKIVIYRIGAGEGDFKRVKEEVDKIRGTFNRIQPDYRPQLVVIIAQRDSHVRVFPAHITGSKAGQQNVTSGTCVDSVITSLGHQEFILSSQMPLLGTVRPCKYTILTNDPNWTKTEITHLTYFRAFGHQVSYQPPSFPDVLYAAENLAKRGRNNYKVHQRFVNLQAVERSVIAENSDLVSEEMREQLAAAIVDEMSAAINGMTISKRNFWA